MPVTIDETANTGADPWNADPAADEPAERPPPILNENKRQAALLEYVQRNFGKHVKSTPWKVPNRSELLNLGRRNVAGNIREKDARGALQQLFKDAPRKGVPRITANVGPLLSNVGNLVSFFVSQVIPK